jgi:hypothetical protein
MAETLPISRNRDMVILTRMVPRLIIQVLVSRFQVLPRAALAQPDGFINGVLLSFIAVSLKHVDTNQRLGTNLPANTQKALKAHAICILRLKLIFPLFHQLIEIGWISKIRISVVVRKFPVPKRHQMTAGIPQVVNYGINQSLDLLTILPAANTLVRINDIGSEQQRSVLPA